VALGAHPRAWGRLPDLAWRHLAGDLQPLYRLEWAPLAQPQDREHQSMLWPAAGGGWRRWRASNWRPCSAAQAVPR